MSHLSFVDLNYWANGVLLSKSFPAPYVGLTAVSEFQIEVFEPFGVDS